HSQRTIDERVPWRSLQAVQIHNSHRLHARDLSADRESPQIAHLYFAVEAAAKDCHGDASNVDITAADFHVANPAFHQLAPRIPHIKSRDAQRAHVDSLASYFQVSLGTNAIDPDAGVTILDTVRADAAGDEHSGGRRPGRDARYHSCAAAQF